MSIKAKLKSSSKIVDVGDDVRPMIPNSNPLISYETLGWKPIISGWIKSVALFTVFTIVLGAGLYAGLAATIAYGVKIDNSYYAVARDTFVGNEITKNAIVYASKDTTLVKNFVPKMLEGGQILIGQQAVPNAVVVKVIAGPTVKITFDANNNVVLGSGNDTGIVLKQKVSGLSNTTTIIKDKYIVECEWGACKEGTYFLLPIDNISGEIISLDKKRK